MSDVAINSNELIPCPSCTRSVQSGLLIPAGDTQVCPHCRDDYTQRLKEGLSGAQASEWVAIRELHIKHEASIRSIGLLYYLGAFFVLLGAFGMLVGGGLASTSDGGAEGTGFMLGFGVGYLALGVFLFVMGRALRRLKRWVKIPVTILSVLGLLNIPIGTLISGYILWLLHSEKGKMVFSEEYAEIVEATPEVKYKTSILVWILLGLLILGLLAAMAIPAFAAVRGQ